MISIILGLHIVLASSTFASGTYLIYMRFKRQSIQGYALLWGGLTVSTIVSGALLTVLADANVMSACANIGFYAILLTAIHIAVFGVARRTFLITPSVAIVSCFLLIL